MCGGRGGIRNRNPRLRRPVLYPIELLAPVFSFYSRMTAKRTGKRRERSLKGNGCLAFVFAAGTQVGGDTETLDLRGYNCPADDEIHAATT